MVQQATFLCVKCGNELDIKPESSGNTGVNCGSCSECRARFSNEDVDEIQTNTDIGKRPIVPILTAARMLGRPGAAGWAMQELGRDVFPHNGSDFVRLSAIRSYADQSGITVVPLSAQAVTVWA